jgi:DeoR/GlpR family transcriptional regulator of sugar metabolism
MTNSLDVGNALASIAEVNPAITVEVTGGTLEMRSLAFVGMVAEHAFEQFFVNRVFLGVRGVSVRHGMTNPLLDEIPIKRMMIQAAREVVVLADHSKLSRP